MRNLYDLPFGRSFGGVSLANQKAQLIRGIGGIGGSFLVLNGMIGAGIFALPSAVAERAGVLSPWLFVAAGLLVIVMVFGREVNGARSWLDFPGGIRIQPSEFVKITTIIALAQFQGTEDVLVEAFQEAWLVTVDGRMQREALPHLSAAERRMRFLRLFSPAGVLTPNHWAIFNGLWEGRIAEEAEVLAKVRLLPPLSRRRRV